MRTRKQKVVLAQRSYLEIHSQKDATKGASVLL